jgi:hypothetical protein
MNLDNRYFLLSQEVRNSFYEDAQRVGVLGDLVRAEFDNEFKMEIRSEELTSAKAMHLGMQVKSKPLPTVGELLSAFAR